MTDNWIGGMYMSVISVNNLSFNYEGSFENVFENVSFNIDTDWKLGFVARNGRGKTTFLKLLMGKYQYNGSIAANEKFDYFPFDIKDMSKNTIDIVEEIFPENEFWKICRELTLMKMDAEVLYRSFETLSFGEQTRVMLAVLFSMEEHFLLIDEPTNHLDVNTREMVGNYLNKKKSFILVSHDRKFIDNCADHILVINKTDIQVFKGNFSTWWDNKNKQDAFELAENEKLKKEIGRLKESAKQSSRWAAEVESTKIGKKSEKYEKCIDTRAYVGEKSRRMQMRRKCLENRQNRAIEEKSALLKNIEDVSNLKLYTLTHIKEVLVNIDDVQVRYDSKKLPAA